METFEANTVEQSRNMSKVILNHVLWGRQTFECKNLQVIDDEFRKGVIIKGQEKFVYKCDILQETDNMVSDGRLTIIVKSS